MNSKKREFYKQLHAVLAATGNVIYDGQGKTTQEITKSYNEKYNESKNNKEIAGGLLFLSRKGIARRLHYKSNTQIITRWLATSKDFYDLVYE
jgi:hypothetical protein